MPFYPPNSLSNKYSSIEDQKIHENKYKQFLKTLSINRNNNNNNNSSDEKVCKHSHTYLNENYLVQRQLSLQSRQDKRKHEYERIQKENLKFGQRLINAKAVLSRLEQQVFFDKHCKLRQQLQHYPNRIRTSQCQSLLNQPLPKINSKSVNPSVLIYNDNARLNKTRIIQKKPLLSPITSIIPNTDSFKQTSEISKNEANSSTNRSAPSPRSNIINWNPSNPSKTVKQMPHTKNILESRSLSTSESTLSDFFI